MLALLEISLLRDLAWAEDFSNLYPTLGIVAQTKPGALGPAPSAAQRHRHTGPAHQPLGEVCAECGYPPRGERSGAAGGGCAGGAARVSARVDRVCWGAGAAVAGAWPGLTWC